MELREKIAELISPWMEDREYHAPDVADEILAIPEIANALRVNGIVNEAIRKQLNGEATESLPTDAHTR